MRNIVWFASTSRDNRGTSEDKEKRHKSRQMAEEVALVPIKNSLADLDELEMFEMQQENSSHEIISKIRSIRYTILQRRIQLRK